ncbi:hypothetical protein PCE1_004374 [Barthelona sp. PCE]
MKGELGISVLGAAQDVGGSCYILYISGFRVLIDVGLFTGRKAVDPWPQFEVQLDTLKKLDAIIITHHHMDHVGSILKLLELTSFKGPIYMTDFTDSSSKVVISDSLRLQQKRQGVFEKNKSFKSLLDDGFNNVNYIQYDRTFYIPSRHGTRGFLKVVPIFSSHLLGAVSLFIYSKEYTFYYSGDVYNVPDSLLKPAQNSFKFKGAVAPDLALVEATNASKRVMPRRRRNYKIKRNVRSVVLQGGKILMPLLSLGRAQEVAVIIDQWLQHNPVDRYHVLKYFEVLQDFQSKRVGIRFFFSSPLAEAINYSYLNVIQDFSSGLRYHFKKCSTSNGVHHRFNIGDATTVGELYNPCSFVFLEPVTDNHHLFHRGAMSLICSPAQIGNVGISFRVLSKWCTSRKNMFFSIGYNKSHSSNGRILSGKTKSLDTREGQSPINCQLDSIDFFNHSDRMGVVLLIMALKMKNVAFIHGEHSMLGRFLGNIRFSSLFDYLNCHAFVPDNYSDMVVEDKSKKIAVAKKVSVPSFPEWFDPLNSTDDLVLMRSNTNIEVCSVSDINKLIIVTDFSLRSDLEVGFMKTFVAEVSRDIENFGFLTDVDGIFVEFLETIKFGNSECIFSTCSNSVSVEYTANNVDLVLRFQDFLSVNDLL